MSRAWKEAEKEVAEFFGGTRRIRVSYSESVCDVIHSDYSLEVKYGKQIPKYLKAKVITVLESKDTTYILTPSELWGKAVNHKTKIKKESVKFLSDAMSQAVRYCPAKKPIVCVKPHRWVGFVIVEVLRAVQP